MSKRHHLSRVTVLLTSATLLVACASGGPAPVIDLTDRSVSQKRQITQVSPKVRFHTAKNVPTSAEVMPRTHEVKPGETLYSIAWRYSLDHRVLAKNNQIQANRIYPGQKLLLNEQPLQRGQVDKTSKPFEANNLLAAINKEILNKPIIQSEQLAKLESVNQRNTAVKRPAKNVAKVKPRKPNRKKPSANKVRSNTKLALVEQSKPVKQWIWPVNGKVVGRFSPHSNMNKGLDIVAKKGSPVRATAEGRVVYSGNGLRGYGQLVIIKHNEQFLSAYAHNKKIHVEENEVVKAGQRIAELGDTGSDTDKLHFEIRLKGKPVDPLNYLPKSGLM